MSTDVLERIDDDVEDIRPPQFRLSDDGIAWTPWQDLFSIEDQIPDYGYVQARVWKGDGWIVSEIFAAINEI